MTPGNDETSRQEEHDDRERALALRDVLGLVDAIEKGKAAERRRGAR
ncbi:MAG TPA: hypothetical protein VKG43_01195 [Acidimicrobiales bacterium]|nr:hypothetical protein [Acidimicrobiales bacterium]